MLLLLVQVPPVALDPGQLTLVSMVCMLVVYVLRVIMQYAGWKPTLPVIGVISLVVSLVLSALMLWKDLPPLDLSDPMVFVQTLLAQFTAVVGMATLVYNLVIETLLKKLGLDPTALVERWKGAPKALLSG